MKAFTLFTLLHLAEKKRSLRKRRSNERCEHLITMQDFLEMEMHVSCHTQKNRFSSRQPWGNKIVYLIFFLFWFIFIVCVFVLSKCKFLHHVGVWYLQWPEEGIGSPGTGVAEGCEPPCLLGIQPWSSGRAVCKHWAISPVSLFLKACYAIAGHTPVSFPSTLTLSKFLLYWWTEGLW